MEQITARAKNTLLLMFAGLMTLLPALLQPAFGAGLLTESPCDGTVPCGCTVFTLSKGERIFFGGNDDYINPDSYYWIDPGDAQNYGAIWIGQPDNVQQGINECGLAYDANGLPRVNVNSHSERIPVSGGYNSYPIHILHECASVEQVITWIRTHQWHSFMHDQMHFADTTGDAVIVGAGTDGEVVFTRKPPGDGFLVSTNFNVANPANSISYPCWRYDRARELLSQLANQAEPLTARNAASVLDAVHVEAGTGWTIVSLVADLSEGLVYIYYFHQFDRPVVLNIKEEIASGRAPGPLSRLFPEDVQQEAARRYQEIQAKANRCRSVSMVWLVTAAISVILLIVFSIPGHRGVRFWIPAAIILGPLVLLVWFIIKRERKPVSWHDTIMEAIGDVMPTVAAFAAVLVLIIFIPAVQGSGLVQILLIYGLPLVAGWLIFQGPLLTSKTDVSFGRFLCNRLPQALVAANLGLAGTVAIAAPLAMYSIQVCPVFPLNLWTIIIWWAIAVSGALAGLLLLFLYEFWAIRRGFLAWSVLARGEAKVNTPSWRDLGWWIPLSYLVLLGGLTGSVVLIQLVVGVP